MQIDADIIEKSCRGRLVLSEPGSAFNNRAYVISHVCEIEAILVDKIAEFFAQINSNIKVSEIVDSSAKGSSFLSSAKPVLEVAFYFGFIDKTTRGDLQRLVELRNRYAHRPYLKNIKDEPGLYELIKKTTLYRENESALVSLLPEQVMMAIFTQMLRHIKQ